MTDPEIAVPVADPAALAAAVPSSPVGGGAPGGAAADEASRALRTVPLCELRPGERGRMHGAEMCCDDCELLRAMGLTEECELRVCRSGAPCIVQVNATRLGLSRAMTRRILVSVESRSLADLASDRASDRASGRASGRASDRA